MNRLTGADWSWRGPLSLAWTPTQPESGTNRLVTVAIAGCVRGAVPPMQSGGGYWIVRGRTCGVSSWMSRRRGLDFGRAIRFAEY